MSTQLFRCAAGSAVFAAVLVAATSSARAVETRSLPSDEILGVTLGASKSAAGSRLEEIGRLAGEDSGPAGAKEFWSLDDPRFAWMVVRFSAEERVEWISAFAREKGPAVRYDEIANLENAHLQGSHFYTWYVAADEETAGYAVTARGPDPDHLASLSFYRVTASTGPSR